MRLLTYRELRNEPKSEAESERGNDAESDAWRMAEGVSRTGGANFLRLSSILRFL